MDEKVREALFVCQESMIRGEEKRRRGEERALNFALKKRKRTENDMKGAALMFPLTQLCCPALPLSQKEWTWTKKSRNEREPKRITCGREAFSPCSCFLERMLQTSPFQPALLKRELSGEVNLRAILIPQHFSRLCREERGSDPVTQHATIIHVTQKERERRG